jgi:hypothetical protein
MLALLLCAPAAACGRYVYRIMPFKLCCTPDALADTCVSIDAAEQVTYKELLFSALTLPSSVFSTISGCDSASCTTAVLIM